MAWDTSKALRQQVMYCVYVRQYSKEGTFEKVREDLTRIRDLGVDILWLLPIHPIGKTCRKGVLGSPYAIRDYRAVNEEYGTMQDFERLAGEVHRLGMRLIIDVVYNHTSPDSCAEPPGMVLSQGGRQLWQQDRRVVGYYRPGLQPTGIVGLSD